MDWQLSDPAGEGNPEDRFDLLLSKDLRESLGWTAPRSTLSDSARSRRPDPGLLATLEKGLAYRYVAVNRIVRHEPPRAADERTFYAGSIVLRCFLADLQGPRLLDSFEYQAATDPQVKYVYKTKEADPKERLAKWAASTLWANARRELLRLLAERTGGVFGLKE